MLDQLLNKIGFFCTVAVVSMIPGTTGLVAQTTAPIERVGDSTVEEIQSSDFNAEPEVIGQTGPAPQTSIYPNIPQFGGPLSVSAQRHRRRHHCTPVSTARFAKSVFTLVRIQGTAERESRPAVQYR
jgi:hypothetical protein